MNMHLLQHFGITSAAFLGQGSESQVYALDQQRVVRVYPSDASLAYIHARTTFYRQLVAQQPTFAIPHILDQGVLDGHPYTIEQRMHGRDFAHVLPQLTGQHRVHALQSYLDLAAQIGTIQFPHMPFGELIVPNDGVQRDTWPHFLWDRVQQTLGMSYADIMQDVPHIDELLITFETRVPQMLMTNTHALVHGDYFPGNVFIDNTFTVYGVGDFGYSTVVGDPRIDLVGAVVFLELVQGYQATDTDLLLHLLHRRPYHVPIEIIALYRLYYSLYFSFCKESDPKTYAWCIGNLRQHRWLE